MKIRALELIATALMIVEMAILIIDVLWQKSEGS